MRFHRICAWLCIAVTATVPTGCQSVTPHHKALTDELRCPPPVVPRELSKVAMPTYTIEPPDILIIEATNAVPKSPYTLRTGDALSINVQGALLDAPIAGEFRVQPGGVVNLGIPYGNVNVYGMTVEEAQQVVHKAVLAVAKEPSVSISIVEMASRQPISGQHLVGPDGTVTLGIYGTVPVIGLTLEQAKLVVEQHLAKFLEAPEVAIDVFAYNSKAYYVITEGAGLGDGVTKFPITGNDTVLDAIANINGLTQVSSKKIWIARPVPHTNEVTVLPVDWRAVTADGIAATNYQIMPGDRIFVAEDKLVAMDTHLGKVFAPWERVFGFSLLAVNTVTRFSGKVLKGGGNPNSGNGFGS